MSIVDLRGVGDCLRVGQPVCGVKSADPQLLGRVRDVPEQPLGNVVVLLPTASCATFAGWLCGTGRAPLISRRSVGAHGLASCPVGRN